MICVYVCTQVSDLSERASCWALDGGCPTLELTNQLLLLCCSIGKLVRRSFTSWPRFSSSNLGRATPSCPCRSVRVCVYVCSVLSVLSAICRVSVACHQQFYLLQSPSLTSCCDLPSPRPYPQKVSSSSSLPIDSRPSPSPTLYPSNTDRPPSHRILIPPAQPPCPLAIDHSILLLLRLPRLATSDRR